MQSTPPSHCAAFSGVAHLITISNALKQTFHSHTLSHPSLATIVAHLEGANTHSESQDMVLDALAAVGLAANVLQFVQYGCELISLTSNLYRGTFPGYTDLEAIAEDLEKYNQSLANCPSVDQALCKIAGRAASVAIELLDVVRKIRNIGQKNGQVIHPRWTSFRQALEITWKKDKVTSLQSSLESLRDQLHHHLLADLGSELSTIILVPSCG